MKSFGMLGSAAAVVALLSGCAGAGSPVALTPQAQLVRSMQAPLGRHSIVPDAAGRSFALCAPASDVSRAACLGTVRAMSSSTAGVMPDSVNGLTPDDLASIYGYPKPEVQGPTRGVIGIVVAYDNPYAEADLAAYRAYFGLPACTTAGGCFTRMSSSAAFVLAPPLGGTGSATSVSANPTIGTPTQTANGSDAAAVTGARTTDAGSFTAGASTNSVSANPTYGSSQPAAEGGFSAAPATANAASGATASPTIGETPGFSAGSVSASPATSATGWNAESDADIETASAVCPYCKILLVETPTDSLSDLGNGNLVAAAHGATVINDSFGAPESALQATLQNLYSLPGIPIFAAAGDNGPQVLFPAALPNVIAVAGTTVTASGTTVSEQLWSGSGGGCSRFFPKAIFSYGFGTSGCALRSVADLAAVADPATGVAFYDQEIGGWGIIGGTSVASPVVASMYALSGDTLHGGASQLRGRAKYYMPVLNGGSLTGLGTPTSLAAF